MNQAVRVRQYESDSTSQTVRVRRQAVLVRQYESGSTSQAVLVRQYESDSTSQAVRVRQPGGEAGDRVNEPHALWHMHAGFSKILVKFVGHMRAGKQAGGWAGEQVGPQAGRQVSGQAGRHVGRPSRHHYACHDVVT